MSLRALWPVTTQFQNKNGSNLVSGKVYIYYQGRTALATTYHDESGTVVNANPVLLDNNGRATVFVDTIYSYTIVVCDYYGKELFSQDITLHDAIATAQDVVVISSNGSVKVDTTNLPNGVQYDLSVNTAYTTDPKLSTCDDRVINGATVNYGDYGLANGYDKLVWDDPSSYSWLNARVIQMKRLCTSHGTVTKCNLAICGSLSFTSPPPFINCGIFSTDGTLLGSTGLRLYGTDFFSGSELVSFDMSEVNTGDLNLKNNTYYIIQIITCGLQLASLSHNDSYNYTYDYDLRMNLEGITNKASWSNSTDFTSRAEQIPWISFAASPSV